MESHSPITLVGTASLAGSPPSCASTAFSTAVLPCQKRHSGESLGVNGVYPANIYLLFCQGAGRF